MFLNYIVKGVDLCHNEWCKWVLAHVRNQEKSTLYLGMNWKKTEQAS